MPYIQDTNQQKSSGLPGVKDVYHSDTVYANFVPIVLWQDPQGAEAAVLGEIFSPYFAANNAIISADGEEDPVVVDKQLNAAVASGILKQEDLDKGNKPTVGNSDTSPGSAITATTTTSVVDINQVTFPDSYILYTGTSRTYTLGSVTKAPGVVFTHAVEPSVGLSTAQVVANLQLLVINCVDPVKNYRSDMFLTNSFRPAGIGSSTSQHPKGMACDMQFSKASKADYFSIAQYIRDNISYDQLLLEYKTSGSGLPWIHISFNGAGNRNQVMTFMNDKKHSVGLVDLAAT